MPNILATSATSATLATIRGIVSRFRRAVPGRRPAARPERTPEDRCAAETCTVPDNPFGSDDRTLPYGRVQMARCQVPAQDDRKGQLQPTGVAKAARPDLTPVWCATHRAWYHSGCYSGH